MLQAAVLSAWLLPGHAWTAAAEEVAKRDVESAKASISPIRLDEAVPTISWEHAGSFVGREVFAVGRIVRTGRSRSGHTFLNFAEQYRDTLTLFIHVSDYESYQIRKARQLHYLSFT